MDTNQLPDVVGAENGLPAIPDMAWADGVPSDVVTSSEAKYRIGKGTWLEAMRQIRDDLAPYGKFKEFCQAHGENYEAVLKQLQYAEHGKIKPPEETFSSERQLPAPEPEPAAQTNLDDVSPYAAKLIEDWEDTARERERERDAERGRREAAERERDAAIARAEAAEDARQQAINEATALVSRDARQTQRELSQAKEQLHATEAKLHEWDTRAEQDYDAHGTQVRLQFRDNYDALKRGLDALTGLCPNLLEVQQFEYGERVLLHSVTDRLGRLAEQYRALEAAKVIEGGSTLPTVVDAVPTNRPAPEPEPAEQDDGEAAADPAMEEAYGRARRELHESERDHQKEMAMLLVRRTVFSGIGILAPAVGVSVDERVDWLMKNVPAAYSPTVGLEQFKGARAVLTKWIERLQDVPPAADGNSAA